LYRRKNLFHLLHQNATLDDVLLPTKYGFSILPAASGITEMLTLSTGQKLELLDALDPLDEIVDVFIVDTGAGINDNVIYFNIAVQERLLVLTPEPTSLTDAYALIKVLKLEHGVERFRVVVNMAKNAQDAKNTFSKLHNACDHFMSGISLDLLGFIPRDEKSSCGGDQTDPLLASGPQEPRQHQDPRTGPSEIAGLDVARELDGNIKFFWKKLLFQE
jgi:flagellar biosynthesis protein FlhG